MPLGTPVISYTVVSIFVVVVILSAAFVSFCLQILCRNCFIQVVDALAIIPRMESFASLAALGAIILSFAFALFPIPFLVHGAFAESATAASPLRLG